MYCFVSVDVLLSNHN